jgi:hypothetical protein
MLFSAQRSNEPTKSMKNGRTFCFMILETNCSRFMVSRKHLLKILSCDNKSSLTPFSSCFLNGFDFEVKFTELSSYLCNAMSEAIIPLKKVFSNIRFALLSEILEDYMDDFYYIFFFRETISASKEGEKIFFYFLRCTFLPARKCFFSS